MDVPEDSALAAAFDAAVDAAVDVPIDTPAGLFATTTFSSEKTTNLDRGWECKCGDHEVGLVMEASYEGKLLFVLVLVATLIAAPITRCGSEFLC